MFVTIIKFLITLNSSHFYLDNTDDKSALKISIKLSNGKSFVRKYKKDEKVKCLFAVVLDKDLESLQSQYRPFDLVTRFPMMNLSDVLESTLEETSLNGTQIFIKIL